MSFMTPPRLSLRSVALLDDLQRHGGWLIFYTHDVRANPSSIGCSPGHFARVVELVRRRGISVEPVAQTLARIGAAPAFRTRIENQHAHHCQPSRHAARHCRR